MSQNFPGTTPETFVKTETPLTSDKSIDFSLIMSCMIMQIIHSNKNAEKIRPPVAVALSFIFAWGLDYMF